jgi:hypothetical protein
MEMERGLNGNRLLKQKISQVLRNPKCKIISDEWKLKRK